MEITTNTKNELFSIENPIMRNDNTIYDEVTTNHDSLISGNQDISDEEKLNGYRNGTIIPKNNGKYWTEEDRESLVNKVNHKEGLSRMALDFERTELAIIQQLVIMDLIKSPVSYKCKKKDVGCKCGKCLNFECENNPNRPHP